MNKFHQIRSEIIANNDKLLKFIHKVELIAAESGDEKLMHLVRENKQLVLNSLSSLDENAKELYNALEKELEKRTQRLKKKIADLQRAKEAVASDNYFLEFKKKDLLQLAADLEDAYEEISQQTKELKSAHAEILAKNAELESSREALLDQADYLHEANETISRMHHEVQKQQEEILHKNEELLILNNEKNNLIGIVAHDLKSPLSQIKGLTSILKMSFETLDHDSRQLIELIEGSASRLMNMIIKILDVEAIESRKLNLNIERMELSSMLHAVTERFRDEAMQKSISLHPQIEAGIFINADKDYVDQVLQNLLSNAIKFSPKQRNIFVTLKNGDNNKAVCRIQDEGPGISDEDKKKLFGKYQKLSARPTGNETSTGLGLSIVKKFVESMHGEIWCESELGHGASFFVSFNIHSA